MARWLLTLAYCRVFQLVIGSLEALYNISGVGQTTSDQIASVDRSVGMNSLYCISFSL